jgi:hypothetical protein
MAEEFVRDKAYEAQLIKDNPAFTQAYFDSRGGVNREGYYGDVPSYARLTADEYKNVTNKDGTTNTGAQAALYQKKAYDYFLGQGMSASDAAKKASGGYGKYSITFKDPVTGKDVVIESDSKGSVRGTGATNQELFSTTGGYDSSGNKVDGGVYNSAGVFVGNDTMTSAQYSDRKNIMDVLTMRFKEYNLEALVPTIQKLAAEGASDATITLALTESEAYKKRFSANEERIKAGLTALRPAEYLSLEDTYRQVLRSYGLTQFSNDAYVKQFIAQDVSPTELNNRVVTAVQRVQNASPETTQMLQQYYGLNPSDIVGYVLDPTTQLPRIQQQIAAAEIGSAAARQGLTSGRGVSEALAAQGVTAAKAQEGYATIAEMLPTAEKLSEIYGGTVGAYGQTEAEQEVFNSLASAQRARRKLSATETATFSGQSGASRGAFSTGYLNRQSPAGQF